MVIRGLDDGARWRRPARGPRQWLGRRAFSLGRVETPRATGRALRRRKALRDGGRSTVPPHAPRDCQLVNMLEASVDTWDDAMRRSYA